MDFFGIGILELFFIILIALIVLGPKDMVKAGRNMGQLLRKILLAPGFMEAQRWVRNLPAQLMREAGIDEIQNELRKEAEKIKAETTISLDGEQPMISGTINRSPALTPYQKSEMPAVEAGQAAVVEIPAETSEISYPAQPSGPADIAQEWTGVAGRQAARTRVENLDGFPVEWIRPPEPSAAQEPIAAQKLTQLSDMESQGSDNTDEQEAGQE